MSPKGVEHTDVMHVIDDLTCVHSSMSPKGVEHMGTPSYQLEEISSVHSSMSPKGVEHMAREQGKRDSGKCAFINVAERR